MPADRFLHQKVGHSQKVSSLTDLQYRVWTQYLLSADDFGVMRAEAVRLQADNDALAKRQRGVITKSIEHLLTVGLLYSFYNQSTQYLYQTDWQDFQKIAWPAKTLNPPIPAAELASCSPNTQNLLQFHPGGQRVLQKNSGSTSEVLPKNFLSTSVDLLPRARVPANRLMANEVLANVCTEGVQGEPSPPMDEWARELVERYPAKRRCGWNIVERPLFAVLTSNPQVPPAEAWAALLASLERQIASHQWRVDGIIPRLDNWLQMGLYLQELPAEGPPAKATSREPAWIRKARESAS